MNNTPRTDSHIFQAGQAAPKSPVVDAHFARELELEVIALKRKLQPPSSVAELIMEFFGPNSEMGFDEVVSKIQQKYPEMAVASFDIKSEIWTLIDDGELEMTNDRSLRLRSEKPVIDGVEELDAYDLPPKVLKLMEDLGRVVDKLNKQLDT